jgi:hypothetical protein
MTHEPTFPNQQSPQRRKRDFGGMDPAPGRPEQYYE